MDHNADAIPHSIASSNASLPMSECPVEHLSATIQSLDTVRALHQTVVCLRSALEDAHREINQLKKQISVNGDIDQGKEFRRSVDNLSETIATPFQTQVEDVTNVAQSKENSGPADTETAKAPRKHGKTNKHHHGAYSFSVNPDSIHVSSSQPSDSERRKPMASKIDVKIKVSSNIKLNEAMASASSEEEATTTTTQDDQSASEYSAQTTDQSDAEQPNRTKSVSTPTITDAHPSTQDKVQHRSVGSVSSEGENSVFEESAAAKVQLEVPVKTHDNSEEVDDIELIFSSDDKDFGQDDLVSIGGDYEPWEKAGLSGTPVLMNFASVGSDQETDGHRDEAPLQTDTLNRRSSENADAEKPRTNDEADIPRDDSYDTFDPLSSSLTFGRRWTNHNVLIETDISKCGVTDDTNILDMGRRNTCPNPPAYRPILHREAIASHNRQASPSSGRTPLAVKFSRNSRSHQYYPMQTPALRPSVALDLTKSSNAAAIDDVGPTTTGPKRSASVQTEISALPEHWRSESHLVGARFCGAGFYTLPSKYVPPPVLYSCHRYGAKMCIKSQEARRVLLSDINFTSMVPELSRSADHLCQEKPTDATNNNNTNVNNNVSGNTSYKGHNYLQTPDYGSANRGMPPSFSMSTSPGVSQWTVHENSYGTQTTQTDNHFNRGDSFDSSKSYSLSSRYSNALGKPNRSRSVPSVRCAMCKLNHGGGGLLGMMRTSESMHYTPRVTFNDPGSGTVRGSLPDLRYDCGCSAAHRRAAMHRKHGDSSGSTDSLLDEADDYLHGSAVSALYANYDWPSVMASRTATQLATPPVLINLRRNSENDIKLDYSPSKQSLPFLPKSSQCLKLDHLAKVITKTGRVVVGRVRYIGPLAGQDYVEDETYVGLQLPSKVGDCDGSIDGRRFFDCEPQHGTFVPFKKIVMAWTS